MKSFKNINYLSKTLNKSIINLPSPININMWWNFGSLLGLCLMIQVISGIFLTMHYTPNVHMAFDSIIHIHQNVNLGWLIRLMHMNGASYSLFVYSIHIGRGMYFNSFLLKNTWLVGSIILLMTMMIAFMGYVLPWGQMSFWGATVITNLLSSIPYIGSTITNWLWGGFSVNNPTLNRFYTLHFILPFMLIILILMHFMFLHETGSNNPLGTNSNLYKINFHLYFTWKDIVGFIIMVLMILLMNMFNPYYVSDPENFTPANSFITPIHIQPEWYFLFAYTILRSIPNKLGGVIALMLSILILMIMPFFMINKMMSIKYYPINQIYFWLFVNCVILLTWMGSNPIEYPFILISQILTTFYFTYFIMNPLLMKFWDSLIFYH
uniref:Cytochrome b n=1 Tax=Vanhornia eucnemidarum TaxID=32432 RepID=Q0H2F1_9HYME|nr:cytochrome b [Vanhornia eucnemidarum]